MSGEAGIMAFIQMIRPRKSTFAKLRVGSLGDGGDVVPDDFCNMTDRPDLTLNAFGS
jgi:hypothetical protein